MLQNMAEFQSKTEFQNITAFQKIAVFQSKNPARRNFIIHSVKSRGKISLLNFKFSAPIVRLRALNLAKFIA
nr:hypothetical protein [uncultured Campylobacter sp.]